MASRVPHRIIELKPRGKWNTIKYWCWLPYRRRQQKAERLVNFALNNDPKFWIGTYAIEGLLRGYAIQKFTWDELHRPERTWFRKADDEED